MKENTILNEVLETFEKSGVAQAYKEMIKGYNDLTSPSAQVYFYLCCLASLKGDISDAIEWLRISIEDKGFFYRPEVFEDEDLDNIRNEVEFKHLTNISSNRYTKASSKSKMKCTWNTKEKPNVALVLHGNHQNNDISKTYWDNVFDIDTQTEYLQSPHVDGYDVYRWRYDFDYLSSVRDVLKSISWNSYDNKTLCGFSAGCNTILELIKDDSIECDRIILVAPWIPTLDNSSDLITKSIVEKNIKILITCGDKDPGLHRVKKFDSILKNTKADIKVYYIKDVRHVYPSNLIELVHSF